MIQCKKDYNKGIFMKKTYAFNLIGTVLFTVGCVFSVFVSIQAITRYKNPIWNIVLLSLFSFIQLAFIVFLFYVLKSIRKDNYKKKNIVISFIASLIIAIMILASMSTAVPNYLIVSKLGLIHIWLSVWLRPSTLTLIGSGILMITNVVLMVKSRGE